MVQLIPAIVLLTLFNSLVPCSSARILAILPHTGKSHFEAFRPLLEGLADRGHNLTVVSMFPQSKETPQKYRDISIAGLLPIAFNSWTIQSLKHHKVPKIIQPHLNHLALSEWGLDICKNLLPSKPIQNLLKDVDQYDLAITELFNTDCFLAVVYKLKVPFIALSSSASMPWAGHRFGLLENPAFVPSVYVGMSDNMNLFERMENSLLCLVTAFLHPWLYSKPAEELVSKYIGNDLPPLEEIQKQTGLLLVNTHFSLHSPRPWPPAIVEVGGMHIKPPKPLPHALENFLNSSTHGVVVFSLGSMVDSDSLPDEFVAAFIGAFKKLKPLNFLWKLSKNITDLPDNVLTLPWIPQRDVLESNKVRAFIYHGGLLGLTEAVHCGKPIVAIPLFGDQFANVAAAVRQGIAVELPYTSLNQRAVVEALTIVLSPEYQKRAQKVSKAFRSRPRNPLDTAIFWTEYVLEHGSEHLRMASVDLHWAQLLLLDVILVFTTLIIAIVMLILLIIKLLKKIIFKKNQNMEDQKNK